MLNCREINRQKYRIKSLYDNKTKSFLVAPYMMARSLLFPSHSTHILAPTGGQASESFKKMEDVALGNIASVLDTTSTFLENCVTQGKGVSPFSHAKSGSKVALFNGSTIESLISVPENIVGIRSNLCVFDEAGKIPDQVFSLTKPFTALDPDFVSGSTVDITLYPHQRYNQILEISSAEGVDSVLYKDFCYCFEKMLMGDQTYFAMSVDYHFPVAPRTKGEPMPPQLSQDTIDNAFAQNPYKANREYGNVFDEAQDMNSLLKRSTIRNNSEPFYPEFFNDPEAEGYIIGYDPSQKVDRSVCTVAKLFRDPKKGLMAKLVYMKDFYKRLSSGEKMVAQAPEQIEELKRIIVTFNGPADDYDNIFRVCIDAGAGGSGYSLASFLTKEWEFNTVPHKGIIDLQDPYQKLLEQDYPNALDILTLVNFRRDKVAYYEATQNMIDQGLVLFPESANSHGELEFEETDAAGDKYIRRERLNLDDLEVLLNFDVAKEELVSLVKVKNDSGSIKITQSDDAKARNIHDDKADSISFICYQLQLLRAQENLEVEQPESDLSRIYGSSSSTNRTKHGFSQGSGNPFRKTNYHSSTLNNYFNK